MDVVLQKNMEVFRTPLTDLTIGGSHNEIIKFDLLQSSITQCTIYLDNNPKRERSISNFIKWYIRICTANLIIGEVYYVNFSKPLEYHDADEHLFTLGRDENQQIFTISFPDPNDGIKEDPLQKGNPFQWYDFSLPYSYPEEGIKQVPFYLIDRERKYIYLSLVWMWGVTDYFEDYETGADVLTWY